MGSLNELCRHIRPKLRLSTVSSHVLPQCINNSVPNGDSKGTALGFGKHLPWVRARNQFARAHWRLTYSVASPMATNRLTIVSDINLLMIAGDKVTVIELSRSHCLQVSLYLVSLLIEVVILWLNWTQENIPGQRVPRLASFQWNVSAGPALMRESVRLPSLLEIPWWQGAKVTTLKVQAPEKKGEGKL